MSKYLLLFLLLAGSSFAWLTGWDYMTPVNISSASALTDYQVQVNPNIYNNTGLVGSWHFSEGSGSSATDFSGNGNIGTITIGVGGSQSTVAQAWSNGASGRFGGALSFDGSDDFVDMGTTSNLDVQGSAFTVMAWVYGSGLAANKAILASSDTNGYGFFFVLGRGPGGANGNYIDLGKSGVWDQPVSYTFSDNTWYHVVAVQQYSGGSPSQVEYFVNGISIGAFSHSAPYISSSGKIKVIGKPQSGTSQQYFNGKIDELRIYNRSLSPAEIQEHYNATKARLDYADLRFTQPYSVYETPISLSGTGSALTDYQGSINITNPIILSHMRSDGADLRFFSSATATPYSSAGLPYWIESINSTQAKVWVKANISSDGSTLYMYYGNFSASAQSNGTNTFIQWHGSASASFIDAAVVTLPFIYEARARITSGGQIYFGTSNVQNMATGTRHTTAILPVPGSGLTYGAVTDSTVESTLNRAPVWIMGTYYNIKISAASSSQVDFYLYNLTTSQFMLTTHVPTLAMGLAYYAYAGVGDQEYSFIRKYSATEPSATIGAETVKASGNEAPLPFWLESDKSVWVKIPSLPTSTSTIYAYYGNASAASASNGANTFIQYHGAATSTFYDPAVISTSSYVYEAKGRKLLATFDVAWGMANANPFWTDDATTINPYNPQNRVMQWNEGSGSPYSSTADYVTNQWYKLKIVYSGSGNIRYYRDDIAIDNGGIGTNKPDENMGLILYQAGAGQVEQEYSFARKYASPEPAISSGTEQQPDTTAPSVQIQSPTSQAYNTSIVNVNFTATDNAGVSCTVWLNGAVNSSTCSNYTLTLGNGAYTLNVTTSDASGNTNSTQMSFTVSVVTDTAPPVISIQSPANATYATGAIPVNFTASDESGVSACILRFNGTVNSTICGNYSLTLGNGAYMLNITANDTLGNLNSSAVSFTVNITVSVSNSTTTGPNGIGNVSLNGIPTGATRLVYSIGSNVYSKFFTISTGVLSVRISAKATLQGTPAPDKTLSFQAS